MLSKTVSGIVRRRRNIPTMTSPVSVDKFTRFTQQFVCVGSEVVPLGLNEVSRYTFRSNNMSPLGLNFKTYYYRKIPISIKESKSCAESRCWYTQCHSSCHYFTPRSLALQNLFLKKIIEQKVLQIGIIVIGLFDVAQENTAYQ